MLIFCSRCHYNYLPRSILAKYLLYGSYLFCYDVLFPMVVSIMHAFYEYCVFLSNIVVHED